MVKNWKQWYILFSWAPKSLETVTATWNYKTVAPWKKGYDKRRQCIKKQRHYFADKAKVHVIRAMAFPVNMYGCENWTLKQAEHRRIDAFKLWCWIRLESPLDSKAMQPVNLKGNQHWILIGKTDAENEASVLRTPDVKSQLFGKDPNVEIVWEQEEKRATKNEMVE